MIPDAATALARAQAGELLGPLDLMAIFHLKPSRFYELRRAGAFDRFLVDRPITERGRYAGRLVARHLAGEPALEAAPARGWGAKKASAR